MKTIYQTYFVFTLNDYESHFVQSYHYGEIPSEKTKTVDYEWEELKENCFYCVRKRPFSNKSRIRLWNKKQWIKEEDFESAEFICAHVPVPFPYTVKHFIGRLPSKDFFEWCKDQMDVVRKGEEVDG